MRARTRNHSHCHEPGRCAPSLSPPREYEAAGLGVVLHDELAEEVHAEEALAAEAFATAIRAGQLAADADPMPPRDMAAPSTPLIGKAFLE